jgi:hypothetical protein
MGLSRARCRHTSDSRHAVRFPLARGPSRPHSGALLLLVGATLSIDLPPVDSAGSMVAPEVRARILSEGRARVIVQMRLPGGPHVPEGRLSPAALSMQRSGVAGVRAQILARLAKRNYRLLHQYSSVTPKRVHKGLSSCLANHEGGRPSNLLLRSQIHETLLSGNLLQFASNRECPFPDGVSTQF